MAKDDDKRAKQKIINLAADYGMGIDKLLKLFAESTNNVPKINIDSTSDIVDKINNLNKATNNAAKQQKFKYNAAQKALFDQQDAAIKAKEAFYSTSSVHFASPKTSAPFGTMPYGKINVHSLDDAIQKALYQTQEAANKYKGTIKHKVWTISDAIQDSIIRIHEDSWSPYYGYQHDKEDSDIYYDEEDHEIKPEVRINKIYQHISARVEQLVKGKEKMASPINMKLISIGQDIDLHRIKDCPIIVKAINGNKQDHLPKGKLFVLHIPNNGILPIGLYEFPSNQVESKTDFILLLDPYVPDMAELTESIYHEHGVHIMKKFDIASAGKLLELRRTVFNSAPTATNTILLLQVMDAIILNDFKTGILDLDATGEKNLVRLEKLKNLALSTKFNEERKNAIDKCFMQYNTIMQKKIADVKVI